MKDTGIEEKRLCHYRNGQSRNFFENLKRLILSPKSMEYMSFDGTVTMLLRVVAPQTPVMIDGF